MNLLEIKVPEIAQIKNELKEKISQAPAFFQHSPLVLGFEGLDEIEESKLDLQELVEYCAELGLLPCAVRGGSANLQANAKALKLASLPKGRGKARDVLENAAPIEEQKQPVAANSEESEPVEAEEPAQTKIISTPIRSGQQIYAPNGDLIILSSVSPGAEVLADGNIHIYGALRGRALAGIKGDTSARIFCSSQEAELISIAGEFMVDETLKNNHWKESVQIQLAGKDIVIETL